MARSISTASFIDAVEAEVGSKAVDRPLDDLRRREVLELAVELGQLLVGELLNLDQTHVAHSESPVSAT